jgi:hypothetical protein
VRANPPREASGLYMSLNSVLILNSVTLRCGVSKASLKSFSTILHLQISSIRRKQSVRRNDGQVCLEPCCPAPALGFKAHFRPQMKQCEGFELPSLFYTVTINARSHLQEVESERVFQFCLSDLPFVLRRSSSVGSRPSSY